MAALEDADEFERGGVALLLERVGQLLFLEARRMDENRYREWLELFTTDALYWVPANREVIDPLREVQ